MQHGTTTETSPARIAELFANFFASVHTGQVLSPINSNCFALNKLESITIDVHEVKTLLSKLDTKKGSGSDSIPNNFLKRCSDTICNPLTRIYQASINQGIFPNEWKITRVYPIHKSGDKSLISNYRGIAILNAMEKMFESTSSVNDLSSTTDRS